MATTRRSDPAGVPWPGQPSTGRTLIPLNLQELRDAYAAGELPEPLMLDNDDTSVYRGDEKVFSAHPDQVLEDALDLLGIPHEHV